MGFDIFGPTRHAVASVEHGEGPYYDIFVLPEQLGIRCPRIAWLNDRFYETTTLSFEDGEVEALLEDVVRLQDTYRTRHEVEMVVKHGVRAKDPLLRREIINKVMHRDIVFHALDELRLLCEEAIAAEHDVRCAGD